MCALYRIWLDYCKILWTQKLVTRTRKTYDRALRSLPITQHDKIWKQYLAFVKQAKVPEMACRCLSNMFSISVWVHQYNSCSCKQVLEQLLRDRYSLMISPNVQLEPKHVDSENGNPDICSCSNQNFIRPFMHQEPDSYL